MKKLSKSIRLMPIILSLSLAIILGLSGCVTASPPGLPSPPLTSIPPPPDIPQEVLSIWKSPPVSGAYPPDVSGKVTLEPNKASKRSGGSQENEMIEVIATAGSWQNSRTFHLCEGEWVDIIVSSADLPIYYLTEEPGAMRIVMYCWTEHPEEPNTKVTCYYTLDNIIFFPFYAKCLYENNIVNTNEGPIFTTAIRMFAWHGATEYWIYFCNYSSQKGCEVTYNIYKGSTTPGWGETYEETKLQPWLNELYHLHVSGKITEEEYNEAQRQWLKQFE